jgi:outer membrane protein TolC
VTRADAVLAIVLFLAAAPAAAQPVPAERVTFAEAIQRAVERNPSAAIAAAGILRAEALLADARSAGRLQINGNVTTTTLNTGVEFEGTTVTPRHAVNATLDVRMPVYAPVVWALRAQAQDQRNVAQLDAAETRRQTALATADAYLAIIARRRVVEANVRARDVASAHFDLASELERQGRGSRLNQLRAQQEVSTDETLVESARIALYRAQEALGVLLVSDGPVDAADEPVFTPPADVEPPVAGQSPAAAATAAAGVPPLLLGRADLQLFAGQEAAARRVLADVGKSYLPSLEAIFQPTATYPSQFFSPLNSWRFMLSANVPVFDSGRRASQRLASQAALDVARATLAGATTTAESEVRTAREAVASAVRGLASAEAAAAQAQEVVGIVNVSFRAGAATNIEVIDAERRARDADTQVAVAEDTLRRARLELLIALGSFP